MTITYDNTDAEYILGYRIFYNKFGWRSKVFAGVFILAAALGVNMVVVSGFSSLYGYLLVGIGGFMAIQRLMTPRTMAKKLRLYLAEMPKETYSLSLQEQRFVITTNFENTEKPPHIDTVSYTTEQVDVVVKEELYLFVVNRKVLYSVPKRCLTEEQVASLDEYLKDKALI
ncbi:MAG: hypothetical protein LBN40_01150 [Oscillospiraceae bacterium]|jgi:hypothetical protein|nr:hypothetical protein [Oscillospiraceae bacterium]